MDNNFVPEKHAKNNATILKGVFKSTSEREAIVRWYKELVARLIKKSESIQKSRQQITKLIESKSVLVSKLKEKDEEIRRLNEKVSLLIRELSMSKKLHSRALEEVEMLKIKKEESSKKNEIIEQEKSLCGEVQRGLAKSQSLLAQEKLKTNNLESPLKWQTMQYADPHYFGMLQKRTYLRKEFEKKIVLKQNGEMELHRQTILHKNFRNMLERKPYYPSDESTDQTMEFYKTIQLHMKKKRTTAESKYYH